MWHTLPEAIKLTGRSRRSLYRDMDAGRVSYRVGITGRREMETAELIRVYGDLAHFEKSVTQPMAQPVTPAGTDNEELARIIAEAVAKAVGEAVEPLRKEIEQLREATLRIEHKPERKEAPKQAQTAPEITKSSDGKVKSFADIVEKFRNG